MANIDINIETAKRNLSFLRHSAFFLQFLVLTTCGFTRPFANRGEAEDVVSKPRFCPLV